MTDITHDPEHEAVSETSAASDVPAATADHGEHVGVTFWVGMAIGALVVAGGLRGLVQSDVRWLKSAGAWFVAGGVLVDLVVIPVIAVVGLAGQRLLPGWAWRVVRGALLASALLVAFSWVLVFEPGRASANPTVRPRNYDQGLIAYLVAVWVLAAVGLAISWWADRREAPIL